METDNISKNLNSFKSNEPESHVIRRGLKTAHQKGEEKLENTEGEDTSEAEGSSTQTAQGSAPSRSAQVQGETPAPVPEKAPTPTETNETLPPTPINQNIEKKEPVKELASDDFENTELDLDDPSVQGGTTPSPPEPGKAPTPTETKHALKQKPEAEISIRDSGIIKHQKSTSVVEPTDVIKR